MVVYSSVIVHYGWPIFTEGHDENRCDGIHCIVKVFSWGFHLVVICQSMGGDIRYKVTVKIGSKLALVSKNFHAQKRSDVNEEEHDDEHVGKVHN